MGNAIPVAPFHRVKLKVTQCPHPISAGNLTHPAWWIPTSGSCLGHDNVASVPQGIPKGDNPARHPAVAEVLKGWRNQAPAPKQADALTTYRMRVSGTDTEGDTKSGQKWGQKWG